MKKTEFKLKTGPQGHVYFPKKIREIFGQEIKLLPNAHAAAIYRKDADPQAVIASLNVIIQDLKLRQKNQVQR